ncbi:DUF397 domain-containing protein [Streptomyces sp. NPDC005820]|uniref:DUF397 domain-containing protein n=1 Tax=Streptomyces sp. NPDC005820 TaxID=3157069 RepID=UPI0033C07F06
MTSLSPHEWFKSSYSGGSGTECVECAREVGSILVRDSKRDRGPVIAVQHQTWILFVDSLPRGEGDH